jgi:PhnB protein
MTIFFNTWGSHEWHSPFMTSLETTIEVQPRLVIDQVDAAIAFYREVLGAQLVERFVDARGVVVHAAIRIGVSVVSIAQEMKSWQLLGPTAIGGSPVLIHVTLVDPDSVCARAVERGAQVVIPIADRPYGKREGRVRDPFGHLWVLSRPTEILSAEEIQLRLTNA